MFKSILTVFLAGLLILGALAEFKPALARRGADDSPALTDDQRRGRGRGQDDLLEKQQQQTGRRGQHHLQEGQGHRHGLGRDDDPNRPLLDDSGRGRGRGGR